MEFTFTRRATSTREGEMREFYLAFLLLSVKEAKISLNVYPRFLVCIPSQSPTIRITTRIERHPDNRELTVTWESDMGMSGSSFDQLNGENSPAVFTIFREVNCATYTVKSCLTRGGKKHCVSVEVQEGVSDGR